MLNICEDCASTKISINYTGINSAGKEEYTFECKECFSVWEGTMEDDFSPYGDEDYDDFFADDDYIDEDLDRKDLWKDEF